MSPLPPLALAAAILFAALPARAELVDLELVLAVDVSGSVDDDEAKLQRDGLVAAFRDDRVIRTIQGGRHGRIAVAFMEWAGTQHRETIVGWQVVRDRASAGRFADAMAASPLTTALWTSISSALDFGRALLAINPHQGKRRIIDISGDGANNHGEYVLKARKRTIGAGITINGLPIVNDRVSRYGLPPIKNLDFYYEDCVIGGTGAFLIVANGFSDFARAIRRKLILEIAGLGERATRPPPAGVLLASTTERPPCNAGEIRLQEYYEDY